MSFTQWFNNLSNKWVLAKPSIKNLTRSAPKLLYEKKEKDISIGKTVARFFLWPVMMTAGKERIKKLLSNDAFHGIPSAQNLLEEINKMPFWAGVRKDELKTVLRDAAISNFLNQTDEELIKNDKYLKKMTESGLNDYLEIPDNLRQGLEQCLIRQVDNKSIAGFTDRLDRIKSIHSAINEIDRSKITEEDKKTLQSISDYLHAESKTHESSNPYRQLVLTKFKNINNSLENLLNPAPEQEQSVSTTGVDTAKPMSNNLYPALAADTISENNQNIVHLLENSIIPLSGTERQLLEHLKSKPKNLTFSTYQSLKAIHQDLVNTKHSATCTIQSKYPSMWKTTFQDVEKLITDYEKKLSDEDYLLYTNWQIITHLESIENKPIELEFFLSFFSLEKNKFEKAAWKGLGIIFNKQSSYLKETIPSYLHDPFERLTNELTHYLAQPEAGWKSAEIFTKSLQREPVRNIGATSMENAKIDLQDPKNLIGELRKLAIKNEAFMRRNTSWSGLFLAENLILGEISKLQARSDDAYFLEEFLFNMNMMLAGKSDPLSQALTLKIIEMQKKFLSITQAGAITKN